MTASTLFPVTVVVCGRVLARAHDGTVSFEMVCRRDAGHDGPCKGLGWTEATT